MEWTVDKQHSSIEFTVKHLALTSVRGRFQNFSGEGRTNKRGDIEWLRMEIEVGSISTADEQRDQHLLSPDFFDAGQYPTMIFESTEVVPVAPNRYQVTGNLQLHGTTKPLQFILNITNPVRDPWGNLRVGAEVQGMLQRKEWGLKWNQLMDFGGVMISDEVWFSVNIQTVPASDPMYRVRWGLSSPDDQYQVMLRRGHKRLQATLRNVSGYIDVLNGRPNAFHVEFPLSALQFEATGMPAALPPLLGNSQVASLTVKQLNFPQANTFHAVTEMHIGHSRLPAEIDIENVSLPTGGAAFITARAEIKAAQADLNKLAGERVLPLPRTGDGVQATLWFTAKVERTEAEMAL